MASMGTVLSKRSCMRSSSAGVSAPRATSGWLVTTITTSEARPQPATAGPGILHGTEQVLRPPPSFVAPVAAVHADADHNVTSVEQRFQLLDVHVFPAIVVGQRAQQGNVIHQAHRTQPGLVRDNRALA